MPCGRHLPRLWGVPACSALGDGARAPCTCNPVRAPGPGCCDSRRRRRTAPSLILRKPQLSVGMPLWPVASTKVPRSSLEDSRPPSMCPASLSTDSWNCSHRFREALALSSTTPHASPSHHSEARKVEEAEVCLGKWVRDEWGPRGPAPRRDPSRCLCPGRSGSSRLCSQVTRCRRGDVRGTRIWGTILVQAVPTPRVSFQEMLTINLGGSAAAKGRCERGWRTHTSHTGLMTAAWDTGERPRGRKLGPGSLI